MKLSFFHTEILGVSHNRLTGTIPSEIGSLNKLSIFSITWNDLSGTIPKEICDLPIEIRNDVGNANLAWCS